SRRKSPNRDREFRRSMNEVVNNSRTGRARTYSKQEDRSFKTMTLIRRNTHWIVALIGIVSLAYAAGMMHERLPGLGVSAVSQAAATAPQPASAAEMSNAFRHAAREALPGMVSIETRGKAAAVRGGANGSEVDPEDALEGSPFG